MPGVDGDGAKLDGIEKREKISTDDSWLLLAAVGLYHLDAHFLRSRFRGLLLVEALAVDSVGKSFQHQRSILHRWEDEVCNARVIAHHISLGVLLLWKEDLIEIRDLERLAAAEIQRPLSSRFLDGLELTNHRSCVDFYRGSTRSGASAGLKRSGFKRASAGSDARSRVRFGNRVPPGGLFLDAGGFQSNLFRILVVTNAEKNRLTKAAIGRPS